MLCACWGSDVLGGGRVNEICFCTLLAPPARRDYRAGNVGLSTINTTATTGVMVATKPKTSQRR